MTDLGASDWTDRSRAAAEAVESGSAPTTAVMDHWRAQDWTVEREDGDFLATGGDPLDLTAYVRVVGQPVDGTGDDGGPAEASEGGGEHSCEGYDQAVAVAVEEVAEIAPFFDGSLAVVATVGEPSDAVRDYADEHGVRLQDASETLDGG